jgi:hypothetical protein
MPDKSERRPPSGPAFAIPETRTWREGSGPMEAVVSSGSSVGPTVAGWRSGPSRVGSDR